MVTLFNDFINLFGRLVDLLTDSITGAVALTAAPGPTDGPTQTAAVKAKFLTSFQEQLLPEAFATLASLHFVKEMGPRNALRSSRASVVAPWDFA